MYTPEVSVMGLHIELSGGKHIKGFNKSGFLATCADKFRGKDGWVHLHFKARPKGAAHVVVQANSVIDQRRLVAQAEGFGIEEAFHDLLRKLDAQLGKGAHT